MNKIQTQLPVTNSVLQLDRNYIANENGDIVNEHGEVCGSVDYETGKVELKMSYQRAPINPNSNKPYFTITDNPFDGEWVAGEVTEIPSSAFGGDDD